MCDCELEEMFLVEAEPEPTEAKPKAQPVPLLLTVKKK
jgi:hypothetical protein